MYPYFCVMEFPDLGVMWSWLLMLFNESSVVLVSI